MALTTHLAPSKKCSSSKIVYLASREEVREQGCPGVVGLCLGLYRVEIGSCICLAKEGKEGVPGCPEARWLVDQSSDMVLDV